MNVFDMMICDEINLEEKRKIVQSHYIFVSDDYIYELEEEDLDELISSIGA